jgi:hypothetical protein
MSCNGQPQPEQFHDDDTSNLVAPKDACPTCGERHVDHLVWTDDDIVHCTTCGTEYDPLGTTEGGEDGSA